MYSSHKTNDMSCFKVVSLRLTSSFFASHHILYLTVILPPCQKKADQLHSRDYLYMPTDYRHTDKHLRLVMTPIAICCTRQSRAPNKVKWFSWKTRKSTDKQMDRWTDGRYQVHYLPASRAIIRLVFL